MRLPILPALLLLLSACAHTVPTETIPMIGNVQTGEFWFRLDDGEGHPQGYAHMVLTTPDGGGIAVDWELRIAWSGGSYEETRTLALDAGGRMTRADYRVGGETVSAATRSGEWLRGFAVEDGHRADIELKIPDDAITGMLFILGPGVPLEAGGELAFQELDEAHGFSPLGPTKIVYGGPESLDWEGRSLPVHRVDIRKRQGEGMPVWVTKDGRIVKSDWGGGNVMVLSSTDTRHFFDPKPPAVFEVPGTPDRLVVEGSFPGFSPAELFDHFTKEDLLVRWWAVAATVSLAPGGAYVLEWPEQDWTLRGVVKEFEPVKRLVFTWAWDHMKESPTRTVTVEFEAVEEGTRLRVTHGTYGEGEDEAKERAGHLAGWMAVLSRLRDLK